MRACEECLVRGSLRLPTTRRRASVSARMKRNEDKHSDGQKRAARPVLSDYEVRATQRFDFCASSLAITDRRLIARSMPATNLDMPCPICVVRRERPRRRATVIGRAIVRLKPCAPPLCTHTRRGGRHGQVHRCKQRVALGTQGWPIAFAAKEWSARVMLPNR